MKANKLFFLAGVALLMACSGNGNHTIGSSRNVESTSSDQTTESTSSSINSDVTSSSSSSSSSSNSSSGSSSSSSQPNGTLTKTVTFYNGGFTSSSLDKAASQNSFVTWFNNGDDTLRSIGYDGYLQLNEIDDDHNTTMILGSKNNNGKLTLNFNYYIHSVKAVVQPYTKYIAYTQTYNNDRNATFLINTTEYDLSLESTYSGPTENKTFTQEFDGNSKSFSIGNKENNQRVFVHSLEITYYTVD